MKEKRTGRETGQREYGTLSFFEKEPPGAQIHQSMMNNSPPPCSHPPAKRSQSEVPRQKKSIEWAGIESPANTKEKKGGIQPIIVRHTECSYEAVPLLPLSLVFECALLLPTVKSRSAFCESSVLRRRRGCGFRSEALATSPAPFLACTLGRGYQGDFFGKWQTRCWVLGFSLRSSRTMQ